MSYNSARPVRKSYSVFVNHLSFEVTKKDLRDLFEDCGDITEVFIATQSKEMCFTFGFVRFKSLEAAKRAQEDLHGWELKGNKIIVKMSKESLDIIKGDNWLQDSKRKSQLHREQFVKRSVYNELEVKENTEHMEGLKNFSRLKEALKNLELEADAGIESSRLDLDKVMNDVNEDNSSRLPARVSDLFDLDTSVETAHEQLLQCKCCKTCSKDKQADEFMASLQLIINNIDTFLKKSCRNSSTKNNQKMENSSEADGDLDKNGAVISSPTLSSVGVTSGRAETVNFEISPFGGARPKEKAVSSSEEESGSCGEDLSSRLLNSTSFSRGESLRSMESFVQTVLGRGRGMKTSSKFHSPASPGVSTFQRSLPAHSSESPAPGS